MIVFCTFHKLNKYIMSGPHIYILREREFLATGELLYKVGRTRDVMQRFKQYPKGSQLNFVMYVSEDNILGAEKIILCAFRDTFKHRTDIGKEYFEGDILDMVQTVINILQTTFKNAVHCDKVDEVIVESFDNQIFDPIISNKGGNQVSYSCPRCGYTTRRRSNIGNHFKRTTPCHITMNGRSLTEDIKRMIMNGSYRPQKPSIPRN
jgi:uncharacterized C2H2 Zn-finger protein